MQASIAMRNKQQVTAREREILQLMTKGNSSAMIAEELDISLKTVETHRKNMLKKFNAINAVMLMHIVTKAGIV